jgi:ferredoxin--NADP+ reductase
VLWRRDMFPINAHEELAPGVHRMTVKAPIVASRAEPGQFIILIIDEKGERVPFTLSGWDRDAGTVDFIYLEVGKTTRQLATLKPGDSLAHFVGPLGRPAELGRFGHVVALASSYGIGGLVPILRALKEQGNRITTIVQAPDQSRCFGEAQIAAVSDRVIQAFGDPANGDPASATGAMRMLLAGHRSDPIDRVILMGSLCVMRLVSDMTRPYAIRTMVHLTPLMVDGTGMCGACRLSVKGSNRFACVHGPEFDGHEVEGWDLLMSRRCTYADETALQQSFQCRGCSQW